MRYNLLRLKKYILLCFCFSQKRYLDWQVWLNVLVYNVRMKPAFPAHYIVENNGKKLFLCHKHMEQELRVGGKVVERFDGEIGCSVCSADRINS